jgi:hypothetical protein
VWMYLGSQDINDVIVKWVKMTQSQTTQTIFVHSSRKDRRSTSLTWSTSTSHPIFCPSWSMMLAVEMRSDAGNEYDYKAIEDSPAALAPAAAIEFVESDDTGVRRRSFEEIKGG